MEVKIALAPLRTTTGKPAGYYEDFVRHGRVEHGSLFIDKDICVKLLGKYASSSPHAIGRKVRSLTGAAFRAAAATMKGAKVMAAASEIERRLTICRGCEFFQDNPMKCQKCGCYLNLKTRLETEHCPVGKW